LNYVKARHIDLFGEVGSIEFGDAGRGWPWYVMQGRQELWHNQSGQEEVSKVPSFSLLLCDVLFVMFISYHIVLLIDEHH
jgi:hypothetical protein